MIATLADIREALGMAVQQYARFTVGWLQHVAEQGVSSTKHRLSGRKSAMMRPFNI
jgi:hypothetical protein